MARRYKPDPRSRLVFLAVLAMWVIVPIALQGRLAQDALPFLAAGDIAHDHPASVYATSARDLYDLPPAFAQESCRLAPAGTKCSDLDVAYVSTPQAMPLSWLVGELGPTGGVLFMRLMAALALAGGMLLLWQRLAMRTRHAGTALAATAVLLTPMAMIPLSLGQNSPLLFLSACLGLSGTERNRSRAAGVALLWVAIVALKLFPLALVAVLLWQRRGRVLGWSVLWGLVLSALALLVGPLSWYGDFVRASRRLSSLSLVNPYNGAVDAAIRSSAPSLSASHVFTVVLFAARLALVGAIWWFSIRRADDDTQWAWASVAVLVFVPLVWWHYLWVGIAAVAVALAGRRRLDDRVLLLLPALALVSVPISIPNARHGAVPWAQALFLVSCICTVPILLRREGPRVSDPGPATSPAPPQPTLADR